MGQIVLLSLFLIFAIVTSPLNDTSVAFDAASPAVITGAASNVTTNSATVSGNLTALGTANPVNVFFEYDTTTSYGSVTAAQSMNVTGTFSAKLVSLSPGTVYHFRAKADGGVYGTATGADMTFTTKAIPPAVRSTVTVSDITVVSATVSGNLTSLGTANPVNVFFEYGTTTSYGSVTAAQSMTGIGAFSAHLASLDPGTTYHFRAKADGGVHGTATGADMTFTTLVMAPGVITSAGIDEAVNTVTLNGELRSMGTAEQVNVFFEYGTTTSYGGITAAQPMTGIGAFSAILTGLSPGTFYHFRAKADGGIHGTDTGEDLIVGTWAPYAPEVSTSQATEIATNAVAINGNLWFWGTAEKVNVFFEYGTTTGYGSNTTAQEMAGTGAFSANLTSLSPGTTYHFRAKADGGIHGIATGADMTFTTLTPPTVITVSASDVSFSSATLNGKLTTLFQVASIFFEYGTTTSYGSAIGASISDTGAFSASLANLNPGTTYHFRAKADGDVHGTAAGADMTFTTTAILPAVITVLTSDITTTSATVNGNLTALGKATAVSVFFEYGTTTGYGSVTAAQSMTATGTFSANLTGLSPGTTYHFRAKADGGVYGTATGADMTSTTTVIPPAVTTVTMSDITTNSATVRANLTALGSANPVNVFFEYGTTTGYGSVTAAQSMTGIGAFSANLLGLKPGTTYHFRAKADGSIHGTVSGADMTFTTLTPPASTAAVPTPLPTPTAKESPVLPPPVVDGKASSGSLLAVSVMVIVSVSSFVFLLIRRRKGHIAKENEEEYKKAVEKTEEQAESTPADRLYKGIVSLRITGATDFGDMSTLEECLRHVEDMKIVQTRGSAEAITIVVSVAKPLPLVNILRAMPPVSRVVAKKDQIMVTLKSSTAL